MLRKLCDELRSQVVVNEESSMPWSIVLAGPGILIAALIASVSLLLLMSLGSEATAWILIAGTCPLMVGLLANRDAEYVRVAQRYAGIIAGILGLAATAPFSAWAASLPPLARAIASTSYVLLLAAIAAAAFGRSKKGDQNEKAKDLEGSGAAS